MAEQGYGLREATPQDLLELVRLERASGMEDQYDAEQFGKLMLAGGVYFAVAEDLLRPGVLVGYSACHCAPKADVFVSVVVAAGHRGRGLGRELLRPRRPGLQTLAIVRESDLPSQLFLKACGFLWRETEAEDAFKHPPEPGYVFFRAAQEPADVAAAG